MSNIPASRPVPPTTATKNGTKKASKRKATTEPTKKAKEVVTKMKP
jgi:hypothetical protein